MTCLIGKDRDHVEDKGASGLPQPGKRHLEMTIALGFPVSNLQPQCCYYSPCTEAGLGLLRLALLLASPTYVFTTFMLPPSQASAFKLLFLISLVLQKPSSNLTAGFYLTHFPFPCGQFHILTERAALRAFLSGSLARFCHCVYLAFILIPMVIPVAACENNKDCRVFSP